MEGFFFGGGFTTIFFIMFGLVAALILVTVIRSLMQWNKNNHSPRLCVSAGIVAKRMSVHHSGGAGNNMHGTTSTVYYATFQVESGDRMELQVPSSQYGYLVEGDHGKLEFQGTRFLSFERE